LNPFNPWLIQNVRGFAKMSGYADEISKAGFLQPGLLFIEKPFTSNALALKLREVLDRSDC
jgi:hypothetical protein